ncbi:MAG: DUF5069 domain-containing protein [Chloroflexi bacterium]|nr:DUF5069 domain-containing protein [Chloroflexota bacterium]
MEQVVPLISSDVAGPLGTIHLPRLWQKLLLSAKGRLAEGYTECGKGFDQMLLDALKLDREATIKYVKENLPTYPQFEQWVVQQRGGKIPADEIAASNRAIRTYVHPDEDCKEILEAAGMPDTGQIRDAVNLNNLDDWTTFHQQLTQSPARA